MAYGGGTFITQNKKLPGAYTNVVSAASSSASASDRGTAAIGLALDWGEENKVVELTNRDFLMNSLTVFGYSAAADEMKGLRDIFKNAQKVLVYRLNGGGTKASNSFGTAKCAGTRGNDLKTTVEAVVDDSGSFDVKTFLGTTLVDTQRIKAASEFVDNDFVVFNKELESLSANAGETMSGGENGSTLNHNDFLKAIQSYSFNAIGVVSDDSAVNDIYAAFCKDMREHYGVKFQAVLYNTKADFEGVINVKNDKNAVYWVLGVEAGTAINKSATSKVYDGEFDVPAEYTQDELEDAIDAGEFVLHKVGSELRVLSDINSLTTFTDEKNEIFRSNQTVRVADQIVTDAAACFNERYLGKVQNDAAGRESFWGDIRSILKSMQSARAIEEFDDSEIIVQPGSEKGSVVFSIAPVVIGTMEKLYMTCVIS